MMSARWVTRLALVAYGVLAEAAPLPSWEEAYQQAEATLAKMNEPLVHITGMCQRQIFVNDLLFQRHGKTASGAPYYSVAGYYLYFDPSCDGKAGTGGRWVLAGHAPDTKRQHDLDGNGRCSDDIHAESQDSHKPPMGTSQWQMLCGEDHHLQSVSLTLHEVPHGEKLSLLRGLGWEHPPGGWFDLRKWWYIGNTVAIPRLNIPSLNMQDAAGGFRTNFPEVVGTVTAFPSLLCMGATWDRSIVKEFGEVLGEEFSGKGANGILGPSVNVHRVARNGRNFEYMSGEDPYLGSVLGPAYVEGVQSKGVFAVVKHWVFNHQETHRGSQDSEVDDKTAWELYYPPFQAAVDAGVSAAMCSYNKADGVYSCSNKKQLGVLHDKMGFKGFVQSDWWATHDESLNEGLDQEMPGTGSGDWQVPEYFKAENLEKETQEALDTATKRVLAVIYRMNLAETTKCTPPNCKDFFLKTVTTPEHVSFARRSAAKSVVLLKNEGQALPLSGKGPKGVKTIAIIGSASDAPSYDPNGQGQNFGDWATGDYYSGGGSGHLSGDVVTPLAGLRKKAQELGIRVVSSLTNDINAGVAAARQADVAVIVAGTTSGESRDRVNLNLDDNADGLIDAVQKVKRTIVLVEAPGTVVMPWRHSVDGIMIMFLGGQETGNAWADVVFGDMAPEGRLPLMIPETEADTIPVDQAETVYYSEGLETSYRSRTFRSAYAFGHGLTYTSFDYHLSKENESCADFEGCEGGACHYCITTHVKNNGSVAAPTVVQLYLQMPPAAGHPAPFLKGFKKTGILQPGAKEEVKFALKARDVSYYDTGLGEFTRATGTFVAHIGESSADRRLALTFCLGGCTAKGLLGTSPVMLAAGAAAVLVLVGVAVGVFAMAPGKVRQEEVRPLVHDA